MDTVTSGQRSKNMSAIRSKDTKPEIYFRKLLFARGYRYRVNSKQVSGHPDVYLKKYNTAIFIHGCFWHRHEKCKYAYIPKSNVEFWNKKFDTNIRRDAVVQEELRAGGIKCLIIWECTVKQMKKNREVCDKYMELVENFLVSPELYKSISTL
ncbi:MAG: very short patch repair endonuclease [Lachnospiraceae bacterium]|nr:very short patch repair endonuclease [Lachnospiraceae bacterium]